MKLTCIMDCTLPMPFKVHDDASASCVYVYTVTARTLVTRQLSSGTVSHDSEFNLQTNPSLFRFFLTASKSSVMSLATRTASNEG